MYSTSEVVCPVALSGISILERMEDSDEQSLSGPPGGSVSVRYSIPGERVLLAESDNDLPLREPPGGSVRYIIPGEGPLVEDYCIKILHWSRSSGYKAKYLESISIKN